jgi:hypothetical protein
MMRGNARTLRDQQPATPYLTVGPPHDAWPDRWNWCDPRPTALTIERNKPHRHVGGVLTRRNE